MPTRSRAERMRDLYAQRRYEGWCSPCARRKHDLCTGIRTEKVGRSSPETAMRCDCTHPSHV